MNEKITIRRFAETDAETVQNIIHRGLREINGKDYPAELIEKYCAYFSLEKIKSQAYTAHMYVAVSGDEIVGTGSIAPYWGSEKESILLTIYIPDRKRRGYIYHSPSVPGASYMVAKGKSQ